MGKKENQVYLRAVVYRYRQARHFNAFKPTSRIHPIDSKKQASLFCILLYMAKQVRL